jgi:beta-N-acetylhexosaminidase
MVRDVIRGFIGFQGLLMSDDVSMGALSGTIGERSKAAIAAGCDVVLHCNGKLDEMRDVADSVPLLAGEAVRRADAALMSHETPSEFDAVAGRRVIEDMLAPVWKAAEVAA